jgi:hypothetical protein
MLRLTFAAGPLIVIGARRCPVSAKAIWTDAVANSESTASGGMA